MTALKPHEIEEELVKTLEDQRLSRSEKRALGEWVQELSARELSLVQSLAFKIARRRLDGDKRTKNVMDWLEEVVKTLDAASDEAPESKAYFSPGQEPLRTIVGLFAAARDQVDVCVFTITDDRIAKAILEAHARGVKLRIVTDDEKAFDRGSDIDRLHAAGIALRTDNSTAHMHHKFAIFDRQTLLTGSYNWTRSAAEHNHENVLVTADPRLTASFAEAFDRLWSNLAPD